MNKTKNQLISEELALAGEASGLSPIEYYKPDLVILDGIRDLVGDINDGLPHMKPTIILETSYKDVGNMMWWGFRNAPRFKSQKALYLLLSGAERSKDNFILLLSLA